MMNSLYGEPLREIRFREFRFRKLRFGMILRGGLILILMLSLAATARAKELTPLASGGAPPCSNRNGTREFHSAVVQDRDVSAFIVGIARRDDSGCHQSAEIRVESGGAKKSFPLPSDGEDFEIVDFSPDGSKLFVAEENSNSVRIAMMPLATGEMRWQDVSDLLGWNDCDATIEPEGFTADGRPAVLSKHSVLSPPRRPNCVQEEHTYTFDAHWKAAALNSDAASIKRIAKTTHPEAQPCKSDPDLVGECFTLQGRLSAYNGNPTFRIWRIGTRRMLGITEKVFPADEEVLPESLAGKVTWDVEAWGEFLVCPFTADQPGVMQKVCIESANDIIFKHREPAANVAIKP